MNKLALSMFIFMFLVGLGITSNHLFAQDMSGWADDDDDDTTKKDDNGWADDDDDDTADNPETRAYEKAREGDIKDCETFLSRFPNSKYYSEIEARLKDLEANKDTTDENNLTAAERARLEKERMLHGDTDNNDGTGTGDDGSKVKKSGTPLTSQEMAHLWNGASPWTVKMVPHAHFGLIFSKTDWKGDITDGAGSNIVVNAGAEYEVSEYVNKPMSVFADLGLRLTNKNPWDTDGFAVTGWFGAKYLIQDLESSQEQGFIIAAAMSVGVAFGDGDHEANFGIWTGHMNPPVFLVTPMLTGIASYKINGNSYINGTLGFMFFVGTEDDEETYPLDQSASFAIEASAEYFMTFELLMKKFGVHGGFAFRSAYDPTFSIYAKVNSLLGPYMQLVIPFGSETSSVSLMFVVGYNMPLYEFDKPATDIEEPVKEETPTDTPTEEPTNPNENWEE